MVSTTQKYGRCVVCLVLSITGIAIFVFSNQFPSQTTIRSRLGPPQMSAVSRSDDMAGKSAGLQVTRKTTTSKFLASTFKTQVELNTFQDVRKLSKAPASLTTKLTLKENSGNESFLRKHVLHSSVSSLFHSVSNSTVFSKGETIASVAVPSDQTTSRSKDTFASKSSADLVQMTSSVTKPVYLCVTFQARLGNHMFQFASLLGIARLHGMTPAVPKDSPLRNVFSINVTEVDWEVISGFKHVSDKRHCAFDPIVANFSSNLTMHGFFQSWRYFSNVYSELRKQFTFKEEIVKRARLALETSIQSQHPYLSLRNTTFVGIHVRRGDMVHPNLIKFGYAVGSKDYLFRAMDYFLSKYHSVMFIVCSNDMEWSRKTIPHQNVTFILGQQAEVDMAILGLCNHTIMTVGSYGWWSAWLARGTTIYQIQQVIPGTTLDKRFNLTDYMLPDWIGMNGTGVTIIE